MDRRLGYVILGVALCVAPAFSQRVQTRRATITGRGGDTGKCTIEVEVDGSAEVELFGDTGRLRTLSGNPAIWRRFECNGAMPGNPSDFRFSGVDGRGNQTLAADPRGNRGVAVIRIDDPKGGREGYTFDVEWRGGYGSPGGYGNGPYGGGDYRRDRGDYPGGGYGSQYDSDISACQDAVRSRTDRDGYRDLRFYDVRSTSNQRPRDYVSGTFEARRGSRVDQFRYTCSLNGGGRVKSVDIQPSNGGGYYGGALAPSGRYNDMTEQCENAVADRANRDGYGDLRFRGSDSNNNGRIQGTLTARRGSSTYDLDYSCSVDYNNGRIRSVDVRRR